MKYLLLLTSLLALTLLAAAQPRKDVIPAKTDLASLPKSTVKLLLPIKANSALYFNHFEVIDERPDTARIGIRTNRSISSLTPIRDRQIVFDESATARIADYLNQYLARPGAPYTALVVLRSLWVSDAIFIPRDMPSDPDKKFGSGHIHLKAEVYASKDSLYTPLFRFDTLFVETTSNYAASTRPSFSELEKEISDLLITLADSASWVAGDKQGKGRQITRQQINDFNKTRFSSPFDNTTGYTRGVYMSFEEFRNNAPSIQDYEIKTEDIDHIDQQTLYIKDASGAPYYCRTAWGYCDGKSIFIMRDGILCPAWKEGSSFYFFAFSMSNHLMDSQGNHPHTHQFLEEDRTIYTIDMDTGNTY